jgi:hypothetical protein
MIAARMVLDATMVFMSGAKMAIMRIHWNTIAHRKDCHALRLKAVITLALFRAEAMKSGFTLMVSVKLLIPSGDSFAEKIHTT